MIRPDEDLATVISNLKVPHAGSPDDPTKDVPEHCVNWWNTWPEPPLEATFEAVVSKFKDQVRILFYFVAGLVPSSLG